MIEVGRLGVKIAGRDARRKCVIVDIIDDNTVLIDGDVRRKKCNINHIEIFKDKIEIKKGASHEDVAKEFKKLGLNVWATKPKQKAEKPTKIRETEKRPETADKSKKTSAKKEDIKKKKDISSNKTKK